MLTPKEKKRLERLESDLGMPRWKYLLLYGLSFGILLAIFTTVIDMETRHITLSEMLRRRIWFSLVTIPVTGFLFARILHWLSVKRYLELKRKDSAV